MVFVERRLDLRAAVDIRRRDLLLLLVFADDDSRKLACGFCGGGGCRPRAVPTFSTLRDAPLVEHPRRNGGRKLFLSRADSLARSVHRPDSFDGLHFFRRSNILTVWLFRR